MQARDAARRSFRGVPPENRASVGREWLMKNTMLFALEFMPVACLLRATASKPIQFCVGSLRDPYIPRTRLSEQVRDRFKWLMENMMLFALESMPVAGYAIGGTRK